MVESLKRFGQAWMSRGALVYVCALGSSAHAQVLIDPTRPPGTSEMVGEDANRGPILQSILIGAGRKEAIISGKTVKVGDQFGDGRVVSITESEVVLRNGSELQTLKLFPAIEKRIAASGSIKLDMRSQEK